MRNLIFIFLFLALAGCQKTNPYHFDLSADNNNGKFIILMHPTVNNIKSFEYLVENKIFPLPLGYKAIGVYHSMEKFDYTRTEKFLHNEGIKNIFLVKIDSDLTPENLFKHNPCSDTFKRLFEKSNGAIFFGGPDIPPTCYNEPTSLHTVITDPYRHYMELSFLFHLLGGCQDSAFIPLLNAKPEYPILGICLGMQSINVATGGTLVQDIPSEIYQLSTVDQVIDLTQNCRHRNYQTNFGVDDTVTPDSYHQISVETNSTLESYVSSDTIHPFVLSSHHQCLEKLGKGIKVAARSIDGKIIESISHSLFPNVIGVQFHPEVTNLYKADNKIKALPLKPAEFSYIDLYGGDKGENFQRAIWRKFAEKFK